MAPLIEAFGEELASTLGGMLGTPAQVGPGERVVSGDAWRIVIVTDRVDLDKQLGNTFAACGLEPQRARTGQDLLDLVSGRKIAIITTLIHKSDKALKKRKVWDESPNIFMLVDESHRTNFGIFSSRMRQMFPNACYLGFTGTPLMKKEKYNFVKFGGLIEPHYSMQQAVKDTVDVLEETKGAFKSKTLADLRHRLELLLDHV